MGYIGTLVYDRKGVVILREANTFLILEVIHTYMKYMHPDFGTRNCHFHSERKQTRFERKQLVRLCCSMPMHLALLHGVQFRPPFSRIPPLFCTSVLRRFSASPVFLGQLSTIYQPLRPMRIHHFQYCNKAVMP